MKIEKGKPVLFVLLRCMVAFYPKRWQMLSGKLAMKKVVKECKLNVLQPVRLLVVVNVSRTPSILSFLQHLQ